MRRPVVIVGGGQVGLSMSYHLIRRNLEHMLTADQPGATPPPASPALSAECGELVAGCGVALRWPDGELTEVITDAVTGLGAA